MPISERDLKLLWGRAAGRCSICKILVTEDKQNVREAFPIGENAHIVAESASGPRGNDGLLESLRNNYWNLILLCPTCHTRIDKAPEDFPVERLHQFKRDHEAEMARLYPPDKNSYDQSLEFSRVTAENWQSPDRENYIPFGLTRDEWVLPFLQPHLEPCVPRNVVRAFEVARACMIYSWFFYPLATLGLQQLLQVGKLAVHERCRPFQKASGDFSDALEALAAARVLSKEDESRWAALGRLTADPSFLAGPTLFDPGQAIGTLHNMTGLINGLFQSVENQAATPK